MFGQRRVVRLVAVLAAVAVVGPVAAWAGQNVVSGKQSLRIKVGIEPSKARARGVKLHFSWEYMNSKHSGQQPPYNTKTTTFIAAAGMVLNSRAVPSCRESAVVMDKGNAALACPAGSKVGGGSLIVNARPTIKALIRGTGTLYNGIDDSGTGGSPKGSPELILYVKTTIGATATDVLHVVNAHGRLQLVVRPPKPSKPGRTPGSYTVQSFNLTIGIANKPFLSNPRTCTGDWAFALTLINWFNQPSITARDAVKCTSS